MKYLTTLALTALSFVLPLPSSAIAADQTASPPMSSTTYESASPNSIAATKAPHGIFEIGGEAFTNPSVGGRRAEFKWSTANPSDGVYNWKRIDDFVADAVKYHKQLGVSLRVLSSVPTWVTKL